MGFAFMVQFFYFFRIHMASLKYKNVITFISAFISVQGITRTFTVAELRTH